MGSQANLSTLHYSHVEFAVCFANFLQLILDAGDSWLEAGATVAAPELQFCGA
jgi:hypothetical protein